MSDKLSIIVLAGGVSEEREVSLTSAKAVTEALKRLGHEIRVIDAANSQSLLDAHGNYMLMEDSKSLSRIDLKQAETRALAEIIQPDMLNQCDIVFLALHGGAGENGIIQAILDLAGIKYTGSGKLASALAMNKAFAKKIAKNEGIPTPEWMLFRTKKNENISRLKKEIIERFSLPVIIKPNDSGSTVGLTLVRNDKDLIPALEKCLEVSKEILVEQYIRGREITAAVLSGAALPLVEIIPSGELYDYYCKYTKGGSKYVCPAEIPENVTAAIQELALKAYNSLGCSGLARVDLILDEGNRPYFLEVNTLPGMTELSLAPMAAAAAGIDFDELIDKICRDALEND